MTAPSRAEVSSRRLFIGLMPAPHVQTEIDRYRQGWTWSIGARLAPLANLHITIDFLGDVASNQEQALRAGLAKVSMRPFSLVLRSPKVWPKGLAIVEPEENQGLKQLHEDIGVALDLAEIGRDPRPWSPHVTVAREARGSIPPKAFANISWSVESFSLVWARAQFKPAYQVLETWPTAKP